MKHFSDRILDSAEQCGHGIVLAFDPWPDRLPRDLRARSRSSACEAVEVFGNVVMDAVRGRIAAIKFQLACFEALGPEGLATYARLLRVARDRGILTIADAKRADIGTTAHAYARAYLGGGLPAGEPGAFEADAMTIVPFFGEEGIQPFLRAVRERGHGLFVMVRSSNPGARAIQDVSIGGEPWYLHLARKIDSWALDLTGEAGLGDVGFVVGATDPRAVTLIDRHFGPKLLLLPGIGAQGACMRDIRDAVAPGRKGLLAVIGRAILYAYRSEEGSEAADWLDRILQALASFAAEATSPPGTTSADEGGA